MSSRANFIIRSLRTCAGVKLRFQTHVGNVKKLLLAFMLYGHRCTQIPSTLGQSRFCAIRFLLLTRQTKSSGSKIPTPPYIIDLRKVSLPSKFFLEIVFSSASCLKPKPRRSPGRVPSLARTCKGPLNEFPAEQAHQPSSPAPSCVPCPARHICRNDNDCLMVAVQSVHRGWTDSQTNRNSTSVVSDSDSSFHHSSRSCRCGRTLHRPLTWRREHVMI